MYSGQWIKHKKHGAGKFIFMDDAHSGEVYEGKFEKDVRQGHGVYLFGNGDRFEGNYVSNRRSGKGVTSYWFGGSKEGSWSGVSLPNDVR
mmetsp:Transcript_29893/g.30331  ORF Transcript_29893/g.30331 Transcript_29893/m.30331 type:complete len:90 (-) Transcript_29893:94-363(-)